MAAGDQVHGVAVLQAKRKQLVGVLLLARHLGRGEHAGHVDLFGEVPGVRQDHAAAQLRQVGGGDDSLGAGDGDDDVGVGEGLVARWGLESVEVRAQLEHRVALHHSDLGVPATEVRRHAAAHRAVPKHRDALTVDRFVGDAQVRLQGALPHPVFVLGELLDRAVVDDQDRHVEFVAQRLKAHASRGRLFGATAQRWIRALQVVHV